MEQRLIDANVLKESVNGVSTHWLNDWSTLGVLAMIDKQPTVDAVPVDFIKALHTDYVQRSKALQGRIGYMYTLYAIALENLVQNWDSDSKISDEMICKRVSTDGE